MSNQIYGLVDINNFYCSAETLFNPKLNGKAVVVLANNDSCVVSRSQEAKDLGIKMGTPFFELKDYIKNHGLIFLSSNYPVYGELSNRFRQTIASMISQEHIKPYSIDEVFLNLDAYSAQFEITQLATDLKRRIKKWIGLPVCIGIGHSPTLAKLANHIAKKNSYLKGVCNLCEMDLLSQEILFSDIDVSEVWGVGRQFTKRLNAMGIETVLDLALADPNQIESIFGVVLKRTVLELRQEACIDLDELDFSDRKQIVSSRSFGKRITDIDVLVEATCNYLQVGLMRMQNLGLICSSVMVFIESSRFDKKRPYFSAHQVSALKQPTDDIRVLNSVVAQMVREIFKDGVEYSRCGVTFTDLELKSNYVPDLFTDLAEIEESNNLMNAVASVHTKFGKAKLGMGSVNLKDRVWTMKQAHKSPNYFNWSELLTINDGDCEKK